MHIDVSKIKWRECRDFNPEQLQEAPVHVVRLDAGLEADVFQIKNSEFSAILKVWNKTSRPNVAEQFMILNGMYEHGLPVSKPFAWGVDDNDHPVLLMSDDGKPIKHIEPTEMQKVAKLITGFHQAPLDMFAPLQLPRYDFIPYFYPNIHDHPDIKETLQPLVKQANISQRCLIHGDFHLQNIVETEGKYTVIDWTNVQAGDRRYDIAWSSVLMFIYTSPQHYDKYLSAIRAESPYSESEFALFEAIALLRWILFSRFTTIRRDQKTMSKVNAMLRTNKYIHRCDLITNR